MFRSVRAKTKVGLVAASLATFVAWQRASPQACPYALRWILRVPRPGLSAERLAQLLEPRARERLLELGPGDGDFTLAIAERIKPDGVVVAFDLQQKMLDALTERARKCGIDNIEPRQGDATTLPYEDASFDGAFLVTVLGEIPRGDAALRELRRVLKPGGRVVFGETVLDPHLVPLRTLRRRCEGAGLRFDRVLGVAPLGFYARFSVPSLGRG